MTQEIIEALKNYHWSGNVREMEHTMHRAVIVSRGPRIGRSALPLKGSIPASPDFELVTLNELERRYILAVLEATNWKVKGDEGAAARLGLPSSTLYSRMKKLGIKRARRSAG